ncbi:MAG: MSCRAMM family protein, partial [Microthrixaceae bacterium]
MRYQSGFERSLLSEPRLPSSTRVTHNVRDGANGEVMRTGFISHRPHHRAMAIVFSFVLAAAFFAFAPTAEACHSQIAITKIETGAGAPGGRYTITLTGDEFVETVMVLAGETVTIDNVPPGTYVVTELDGSPDVTIVPSTVVVTNDDDGQTIGVDVTNPYPAGKLAITKVATGDTAPNVDSTFDITGPDDLTLEATVTPGDTWTTDWLPLGTYTITEHNAPDDHTIAPNPVTLETDGETVTVTATNPYRDFHGKLAITKAVTGDAAPDVDYTFDVTGPDDTAFTTTVAAGDTWTSDWLPLGTYT